MDVSGKKELTVTIARKERVAPALPVQGHWLAASNLDLFPPTIDVGVFFCYEKERSDHHRLPKSTTVIGLLKASLAQALVTYFPFAGEIVDSPAGEPEVLCNNRGVDFLEAYADAELSQLDLYKPDESVESKLVPKKEGGVLSVQATQLKCGGLVVGLLFDHRFADAYSTNTFLVAWAECAQSKPITLAPTFRRSLLHPRRPGRHHPSINNLYTPLSSLPPPNAPKSPAHRLTSRIYYITSADIDRIQALASTADAGKKTKLECFTAFLWKTIAKGMKRDDKWCKMGVVVDGRSRLGAASMATYFGNVVGAVFTKLSAGNLESMEINEVADVVHGMIREHATREHFLGLIDWIEERRPDQVRTKIYWEEEGDGAAVQVSSGRRFPVDEMDFGWGRPAFGSYHFGWGGSVGHVMPMPSARKAGDWVVYARLLGWQVEAVEKEAGDVFRPITWDRFELGEP